MFEFWEVRTPDGLTFVLAKELGTHDMVAALQESGHDPQLRCVWFHAPTERIRIQAVRLQSGGTGQPQPGTEQVAWVVASVEKWSWPFAVDASQVEGMAPSVVATIYQEALRRMYPTPSTTPS